MLTLVCDYKFSEQSIGHAFLNYYMIMKPGGLAYCDKGVVCEIRGQLRAMCEIVNYLLARTFLDHCYVCDLIPKKKYYIASYLTSHFYVHANGSCTLLMIYRRHLFYIFHCMGMSLILNLRSGIKCSNYMFLEM